MSGSHIRDGRPRWVGRVALLAVGGLLVAGLVQVSAPVPTASAAVATTVNTTITGPPCPDVMVIAASGSAEEPQDNWTVPLAYTGGSYKAADKTVTTYDPPRGYGAGPVNYDLYQRLVAARPQLHFALDAVLYRAAPVTDVVPPSLFHASEKSAVPSILSDVARIERVCGGGVKYVFTGYSQGAWAIHEALYSIAKTMPAVRGKILGITLFGDPEFVPGQVINRDKNLVLKLDKSGIARALRDSYSNVPADWRSLTGSYCIFGDDVCQSGAANLAVLLASCTLISDMDNPDTPCPHFRYKLNGKTTTAAAFVVPKLPTKSIWPHLTLTRPPVGTVNVPYSWTATAAPTARTTYDWAALDAVPPGLTLSAKGVLAGKPTSAGTFSFRIRATSDPQGRYIAGSATVTIKPGVTPPEVNKGVARAWGAGQLGQLGNGSAANSSTAVLVTGLTPVLAVAAGYENGYAIDSDQTVWAWGNNSYGQLGNGTVTDSKTPVAANTPNGVTAIAAGDLEAYALKSDGTVWAWGKGGALGDGKTADAHTPVQVTGLAGVTAIAAGNYDAYALKSDGTVWAWGNGNLGQLGNGTTTTNAATPVRVSGLTGVSAIAAGNANGYAIKSDGTLWAWGSAAGGVLGTATAQNSDAPVQVAGLSGARMVAAGDGDVYARTDDGSVWAWGKGASGALGNGTTADTRVPAKVTGLTSVAAITAGWGDAFAIMSDATVRGWGLNASGQLGNGSTTNAGTPVPVSGLPKTAGISAGMGSTTYALTAAS
jgi:alpha-tubulin suppressor-like RCC1 family protein